MTVVQQRPVLRRQPDPAYSASVFIALADWTHHRDATNDQRILDSIAR